MVQLIKTSGDVLSVPAQLIYTMKPADIRLSAYHRARFFRLVRILAALVLLNLALLGYHILNQ